MNEDRQLIGPTSKRLLDQYHADHRQPSSDTVDPLVLFPVFTTWGILAGMVIMMCGDPLPATWKTFATVAGGMLSCVCLGLSVGYWTGASRKQNNSSTTGVV